jgi:hypothetical protein
MDRRISGIARWPTLWLALVALGCSKAPPPPRTIADIDAEMLTLDALFIGESTGKEVIAPGNSPLPVTDAETGERCWPAYECTHPDCPGQRTKGRAHFLFAQVIEPDKQEAIHCPACKKQRNLATETKEEFGNWGTFVRPYELPETIQRRGELDRERRERRERR